MIGDGSGGRRIKCRGWLNRDSIAAVPNRCMTQGFRPQADDEFHLVFDIVGAKVPEVFGGQGIELSTARREVAPTQGIVASIGFGGRDIRGAVTVIASPELWSAFAKPMLEGAEVSPALLLDVAGEACNLLAGRFRNELLRYGVELACGTPTMVAGDVSELHGTSAEHSAWRAFAGEWGGVQVRFDASFREGFQLIDSAREAIEPATDCLFF
jgi:CheY-specific phosphatase CheX